MVDIHRLLGQPASFNHCKMFEIIVSCMSWVADIIGLLGFYLPFREIKNISGRVWRSTITDQVWRKKFDLLLNKITGRVSGGGQNT